jgi:hypothetical protein
VRTLLIVLFCLRIVHMLFGLIFLGGSDYPRKQEIGRVTDSLSVFVDVLFAFWIFGVLSNGPQ